MKTGLMLAAILALTVSPGASFAQKFAADYGSEPLERGSSFSFEGGQAIFTGVCQGCHMPQAQGAVGAGMYPALAKNAKRSEEHTSELQSRPHLVCRLL